MPVLFHRHREWACWCRVLVDGGRGKKGISIYYCKYLIHTISYLSPSSIIIFVGLSRHRDFLSAQVLVVVGADTSSVPGLLASYSSIGDFVAQATLFLCCVSVPVS
eukprot:COSAG02_NODE_1597_length_11762_cov_4.644002_7_plen_106_part_00